MGNYLALLQQIKSGYLQQLADEATGNPNFDYSIDGLSMSPSVWRNSIWALIEKTDAQMAARQPYILTTRQIL